MKKISAIALLTIATLAASTGLVAQESRVKANIPFNFTVGEKSMPAGEYTISLTSSHLIKIQSVDSHQAADLVLVSKSFNEPPADSSKLVFNKYGDYYFLRRILSPTVSSLNLDIASGKSEKMVRTRQAMLEAGEQTLVAAR